MSKGPVLLWLVMELGCLYLTPSASQDTVIGVLSQSVTLPCQYSSWSHNHNSMCWGKGTCPKSKCNQELVHTDGSKMISRKSTKYSLQGTIKEGDVSLTISNASEDDSGTYCCRIEVPGWFNDVKRNIHLKLRRALDVTTTTEMLPTTVMTTLDSTTGMPPQTQATSALTTAATTCSLTMPRSSEETTGQLTTETFMEGSVITAEPETLLPSRDSQSSTEAASPDPASLTSTGSKAWVLPSTSQVKEWETKTIRISQPGVSKMTEHVKTGNGSNQNKKQYILIIACCVGFMLMLILFLAVVLRGKVTETNCLQKHKRLDNAGENKSVLSDVPNGREEEDGLFTLELASYA
ncbi:T-cell immunoglobulin and mucin domain-containing protein 4 isoform X2 [Nannospalax galili]|uniref:T-cell immunoglobulin and mucin domain-containing protein 4 isoform X2 n=1 Tax=Nannospalax galili TaxID=1026970 RepID=UPI00111C1E57|nr:T-cell immunoglobulin and mucin domain-containing protein 4 isoform X2 [Nannospalax galili]